MRVLATRHDAGMVCCELLLCRFGFDGIWERTVHLRFDRVPVVGELIWMEDLPENVPASDDGPMPTGIYEVVTVMWRPGYESSAVTLVCGKRKEGSDACTSGR